MTDRELLEYAANAAGYEYTRWSEYIRDYDSRHYGEPALYGSHEYDSWNPLNDDGDALRLAVKLNMDILAASDSRGDVCARCNSTYFVENGKEDKNMAVRKSIVVCAAEIGKSMTDTRGTLPL